MPMTDKLKKFPIKPKVAVHKFSSCDGCQLAFLNDGMRLLELAELVEIVHFAEAGAINELAEVDVAFVEGSINTRHDQQRIKKIRQVSQYVIAMGACATCGGIQALRNNTSKQEFDRWIQDVYPQHTKVIAQQELPEAKGIAEYITIDDEVHGCPVSSEQIYGCIRQLLFGVENEANLDSVCVSCKHRGIKCVIVANNEPCLGPVTADGCDALCPLIGRACYGCYGPSKFANFTALKEKFRAMGINESEITNKFRFICSAAKDQAG